MIYKKKLKPKTRKMKTMKTVIRFGNRDQNGGERKEFGCKGFSLNYRL